MNIMQHTARPIRWTLDICQVGTLDETGHVFVYAGGPLASEQAMTPRVRKDGKTDGRSAGVRTCGNCGETGHNQRTCRNATLVREAPTPKKANTRKCGKCGKTGHNRQTCGRR